MSSDGLPSGWYAYTTPEGHPYYYNSVTQATTYEKPTAPAAAAPAAAAPPVSLVAAVPAITSAVAPVPSLVAAVPAAVTPLVSAACTLVAHCSPRAASHSALPSLWLPSRRSERCLC